MIDVIECNSPYIFLRKMHYWISKVMGTYHFFITSFQKIIFASQAWGLNSFGRNGAYNTDTLSSSLQLMSGRRSHIKGIFLKLWHLLTKIMMKTESWCDNVNKDRLRDVFIMFISSYLAIWYLIHWHAFRNLDFPVNTQVGLKLDLCNQRWSNTQ